ncbi:hypothetical protein ADK82_31320, partial [Streptomyces sp. NRRL S-4]
MGAATPYRPVTKRVAVAAPDRLLRDHSDEFYTDAVPGTDAGSRAAGRRAGREGHHDRRCTLLTASTGLGLATIIPDNGVTAIKVGDVDGVKLAGLLVDAGTQNSSVLVQVGPEGASADHSANPTSLQDVFVRVGGAGAGKATTAMVVNSDDTIIDHTWLWRADHGDGVGWETNRSDYGLRVNGDDVLATGLFVEHFNKYDVQWSGENGRTIFFQNE